MELVGWVIQEASQNEDSIIFIDSIGIGKGVYDRLREVGQKAYSIDVRRNARSPERFLRLRDELWWNLREQFEKGIISIPNNKDLLDQLAAIKYKPQSDGKIKVESKDELRRRGFGSPDEADALCLSFAMPDNIFRKQNEEKERYKEKKIEFSESWMTA